MSGVSLRRIAWLACAGLVCARLAHAQPQTTPRIEAGADVSLFQIPFTPALAGIGARVAIPVTPWLAIDTRVRWFPEELEPGLAQGGTTLHVFAGARAAFVSRGRWTLSGIVMPGLVHFSDAVTEVTADALRTGGSTHFAIDMGADVGVRLSRRWDAHLEFAGPIYTARGAVVPSGPPPPGATAVLQIVYPPSVESTSRISAGLSYRAGSLARGSEAPHRGSWLVGAGIGSAASTPLATTGNEGDVTTSGLIGGFTSFPITSWMDADGGVSVSLQHRRAHSPYDGGRLAQGFGGVKLGRRIGRVGYFGKVRAGVQSHSEALDPASRPGHIIVERNWRPAVETGAVLELSMSPRLVWRVDVADVTTFFPDERPADHSLAFTSGVAWRFGSR